jgi:hypothetical protein
MANFIKRIMDWIVERSKGKRLGENPFAERLTFINSEESIRRMHLREYETWYMSDADENLNFYTNAMINDFNIDPIYLRGKKLYFWAHATEENGFKRDTSGISRAIVDTLVNIVGQPSFECGEPDDALRLREIIKKDDLLSTLNLRQMPLTLVEGCGCFKPNVRPDLPVPTVEYYEAQDVDFAYDGERFVGASFRSYYKDEKGKDYVLIENRRVESNGDGTSKSVIDYHLYQQTDKDTGEEVPLNTIRATAKLTPVEIQGIDYPLAVPSTFFDDPLHPHMGRSIYQGKIDIFDDIDQCLSIMSQTCQVSVPVEYVPSCLMMRDANGNLTDTNKYNRRFIETASIKDGDGNPIGRIQTTQPSLNTDMYITQYVALIELALTGVLSPATLGIDVARKDNADAQREKEKVTTMTRNNIIQRETTILSELCHQLLVLDEYKRTGVISLDRKHEVNIKFMEFANPSFENEIQVLGTAWYNGEISTRKYVDTLWRDKIPEADKAEEIKALDEQRRLGMLAPMAYEGNNTNDKGTDRRDVKDQGTDKGEASPLKGQLAGLVGKL